MKPICHLDILTFEPPQGSVVQSPVDRSMLEIVITERSPGNWEWRVCDREGITIMNGFEGDRRAAQHQGERALFSLLSVGWNNR